nr:ferric reduction oxidase 2-like [Tanacetum cinerariifolium]
MLLYTLPVLFMAVLASVYLHLKKQSNQNHDEGKKEGTNDNLSILKRPMIISGLGIVSKIELAFLLMFIALLVWSYVTYLHVSLPKITKESAAEWGEAVWESKLASVGLTFGLIGLSFTPTSIIFVNVPSISKAQWHPFTITSSSNLESERLSVMIKGEGSWPKKLYQILSSPNPVDQLDVCVEGPYGPISTNFLRHDMLVMVSGGSGITPFISIFRELVFTTESLKCKAPKILLISAFKDSSDLTMLELLLPSSGAPIEFTKLDLQIEAYVTREKQTVANDQKSVRTIWLKPNPSDTPITPILGKNGILFEQKESSVGVLVCGPKKMRHEVANICSSGLASNLHFESISFSWAPRIQDRGRRDNFRQGSKAEEQAPKALMAIDGMGWDWSYMANDEEDHALVADEVAPSEFALMANTSAESKVFDNSLCSKDCKKNNDSLNSKITDLTDKLFDDNNFIYHYKLALAQVESRLVELEKNKEGLGYTDVPPPTAQLYLSPKKDLSWTGLPECADDTVTDYSRPSPTIESISEDDQNRNPSETVASPITSKPFIKFVKPKDIQSDSKTDKKETPNKPPVKYVEQYRKPNMKPNVRGNQRNWNNLKSHQLGPDFLIKKKACFNCGNFGRVV